MLSLNCSKQFLDSPLCGLGFLNLLPSECISAAKVSDSEDNEDIVIPQSLVEAVKFYENNFPHPVMFSTEYHMWVRKWREESNEVPKKLIDV